MPLDSRPPMITLGGERMHLTRCRSAMRVAARELAERALRAVEAALATPGRARREERHEAMARGADAGRGARAGARGGVAPDGATKHEHASLRRRLRTRQTASSDTPGRAGAVEGL